MSTSVETRGTAEYRAAEIDALCQNLQSSLETLRDNCHSGHTHQRFAAILRTMDVQIPAAIEAARKRYRDQLKRANVVRKNSRLNPGTHEEIVADLEMKAFTACTATLEQHQTILQKFVVESTPPE